MTSINNKTHYIKNVGQHVEIFDFYNRFICSGDNEEDAMEGYNEVMESLRLRNMTQEFSM